MDKRDKNTTTTYLKNITSRRNIIKLIKTIILLIVCSSDTSPVIFPRIRISVINTYHIKITPYAEYILVLWHLQYWEKYTNKQQTQVSTNTKSLNTSVIMKFYADISSLAYWKYSIVVAIIKYELI